MHVSVLLQTQSANHFTNLILTLIDAFFFQCIWGKLIWTEVGNFENVAGWSFFSRLSSVIISSDCFIRARQKQPKTPLWEICDLHIDCHHKQPANTHPRDRWGRVSVSCQKMGVHQWPTGLHHYLNHLLSWMKIHFRQCLVCLFLFKFVAICKKNGRPTLTHWRDLQYWRKYPTLCLNK